MTYNATEESVQDGSPVELFLFQNTEEAFTFTSSNVPVIYGGRIYRPLPMKRTGLGLGAKKASSNLTITMTSENDFADRYLTGTPATKDFLTIYRRHYFDGTDETIVYWTGSVATVTFEKDTVKVAINPASKVLETAIPRRTYSYPCNHVLYDDLCGVNKELFRSDVIVDSIDETGNFLTVSDDPSFPGHPATGASSRAGAGTETYFNAGYAQTEDGLKYRMILNYDYTTGVMKIPLPYENLSVGDTLKLYAGCDHSLGACVDKFDNVSNYGGFPHVPVDNPFDTGIVK